MERSSPDPTLRHPARFRHVRALAAVALLGSSVGCGITGGSGGCGQPPPRSTDAAAGAAMIRDAVPPCTYSEQGVRGSQGHLVAIVTCPGKSDPFLVAVKVDGQPLALVEAVGAGYGSEVGVDAGAWDSPDTLWHEVEVVVDPLNLFKETREDNNRSVSRVRVVAPDLLVNEYLSRVCDPSGNTVTTARVGEPLTVIATANVRGWYQSAELSAQSAAFSFADTVAVGSCSDLVYGPPARQWAWTPVSAGDYTVEFRVRALGGEPDSPGNNVITRTVRVVPAQ